jgi:hypothetical protein
VTDSAPQRAPEGEAPPSRARSTTIGAVAFVILATPFLIFGWMMFSLKARVDLDCPGGGPCRLVHRSWLSRETVETFTVDELLGASVERNRSSKRGGEQVFRPVLETTKGKFPLSHGWVDDQAAAEKTVLMLKDLQASNISTGIIFVSDQRRGSAIVGTAFTSVGLVLLGVSVWLGVKARRHRRAERAARSGVE